MKTPDADRRSPNRRQRDEQIAAEPQLPPPALPPDAKPLPVEALLRRKPLAVAGIVENGVVRPLDPQVKLPEHARVIIVTAQQT